MDRIIFLPYSHLNIRSIIFDLGGVILNIDYGLTIKAFEALGFENFEAVFTQAKQVGIFDKLDKGLVSPSEFRREVRKLAALPISDSQIDDAWNAMLLDFPVNRLLLLERVRQDYRTFLLSNTNQIHIEVYNRILYETFGAKDLSHFFEKEYYSHVIHMRKPDVEVFQLICTEHGLNPGETLFIDDTLQHVEGALRAGLHAYHLNLKAGERIESLFQIHP